MSSLSVAEKEQSKGIKMLLVAVLCLGLNWPGMKLGLEIVGPVWMVCLRFLLSLPVLALFVLLTKKRLPVLNRKDRSVVFVVAFFQFINGAYYRIPAVYPSRHGQYSYLHHPPLDAANRYIVVSTAPAF